MTPEDWPVTPDESLALAQANTEDIDALPENTPVVPEVALDQAREGVPEPGPEYAPELSSDLLPDPPTSAESSPDPLPEPGATPIPEPGAEAVTTPVLDPSETSAAPPALTSPTADSTDAVPEPPSAPDADIAPAAPADPTVPLDEPIGPFIELSGEDPSNTVVTPSSESAPPSESSTEPVVPGVGEEVNPADPDVSQYPADPNLPTGFPIPTDPTGDPNLPADDPITPAIPLTDPIITGDPTPTDPTGDPTPTVPTGDPILTDLPIPSDPTLPDPTLPPPIPPIPPITLPPEPPEPPSTRHQTPQSSEAATFRRRHIRSRVIIALCVVLGLASGIVVGLAAATTAVRVEPMWSPFFDRFTHAGVAVREVAAAREEVTAALEENTAARERLAASISAGQEVYAASEGKVMDDALRVGLDQQVAAALTSKPPILPGTEPNDDPIDDPSGTPSDTPSSDPTDTSTGDPTDDPGAEDPAHMWDDLSLYELGIALEDLTADTTAVTTIANDLDAATESVRASQAEWQAAEDARLASYTGENGRLDPATLCSVPYDTEQMFTCPAVEAWVGLNEEYKAVFGEDIPIDLSYRTYDQQVEMKQIYGDGAAEPGTSNHGWATAVDLPDWREGGIGLEWDYGQPKYEWMLENAPYYNWVNPEWAQYGGSLPEPWHFEFVG